MIIIKHYYPAIRPNAHIKKIDISSKKITQIWDPENETFLGQALSFLLGEVYGRE